MTGAVFSVRYDLKVHVTCMYCSNSDLYTLTSAIKAQDQEHTKVIRFRHRNGCVSHVTVGIQMALDKNANALLIARTKCDVISVKAFLSEPDVFDLTLYLGLRIER